MSVRCQSNPPTLYYGDHLGPLYFPHQILFIQLFWQDYCFSFCLFSTARLSWHDFSLHHFFYTTFLAPLFGHDFLLAPLFWHGFLLARFLWHTTFLGTTFLAQIFKSSKKVHMGHFRGLLLKQWRFPLTAQCCAIFTYFIKLHGSHTWR